MSLAAQIAAPVMPLVRRSLSIADRVLHERELPKANKKKLDAFWEKTKIEYSHTPDWERLEETEYVWVFIYGTMMKGGYHHDAIKHIIKLKDDGGRNCCPYAFTDSRFKVWQIDKGKASFPVALHAKGRKYSYLSGTIHTTLTKTARIKGQLCLIDSRYVKELDKIMLNGVEFRRRKATVLIPYRLQIRDKLDDFDGKDPDSFRSYITGCACSEEDVWPHVAYMYIGRKKHWDEILDNGYNTPRCPLYSYTSRTHKDKPYQIAPKRWMGDEPFYLFRAWNVAQQRD